MTLSVPPSIALRAARITPGGGEGSAPAIGLLSRLRAAGLVSLRQIVACGGHPCIRKIAPTEVCARQHPAWGAAQHRGRGSRGNFSGPLVATCIERCVRVATDFATQLFATGWQSEGSRRSSSPPKKNPKQNTRLGFLWTRRQGCRGMGCRPIQSEVINHAPIGFNSRSRAPDLIRAGSRPFCKSQSTKHLRPDGDGRQKQAKRHQRNNLSDDDANHYCLSERRENIVHVLFGSQEPTRARLWVAYYALARPFAPFIFPCKII